MLVYIVPAFTTVNVIITLSFIWNFEIIYDNETTFEQIF